jgi:hypothetical protein
MKHYLITVTAAAVVAASFGVQAVAVQPNLERTLNAEVPWSPNVDFLPVRAARLHLDMSAAEVAAIMGEPAKTESYVGGRASLQSLDYSAEAIRTKITFTDGRLSGVALDVFRVDGDDLPGFTRAAWPGLNTATVWRMLGTPSDIRRHTFFGIEMDQLIFRPAGEPEVSLFFVSDRLIAKRVGQDIPRDIFRVTLPSPPDAMTEGPVQVGMKPSDVQALYGMPRLNVPYRFNGRLAEHAIYQTRPGGSFVSLTFVDGIMTEFEDIGRLPDDDIFQGR